MKHDLDYLRLGDTLISIATFAAIFAVGLQYSFYEIFQKLTLLDDEGTTLLQVRSFVADPASYDSLSSLFGPFYFLHKYAIYGALQANVSHDINRLTTIVLWGMIAATCAAFVYRVSRSIVLAAVVQMQLILHLKALADEPGHPQELSLVLISVALALSSFVDNRRGGLLSMIGIGISTGALLLVKVNLGIYLGASLAVALVLLLPRKGWPRVLGALTFSGTLVLPTAIMWTQLHTPWARNYAALVTLTAAASLVTAFRRSNGKSLRWAHVACALSAAAITIAVTCAIAVACGSSLSAIADSVLFRPAAHPSSFIIPAFVKHIAVEASVASLLLALCYALVARKLRGREIFEVGLSIIKLTYAGFVLYSLNQLPSVLLDPIAIPFLWLVLIEPNARASESVLQLFPRIFLCTLAVFQVLQAYPVHGNQGQWAVFLLVPVSAVCIGDATRSLWGVVLRHSRDHRWRKRTLLRPAFILLLLFGIGAKFHATADVSGLRNTYAKNAPLAMPGASKIRLHPFRVVVLQSLVKKMKSHCDGFIGLPGFASLYFWTELPPPSHLNNHWIVDLENDRQLLIVEAMEKLDRACVLHNPSAESAWMVGRRLKSTEPLVRYIRSQFKLLEKAGSFSLLVRRDRPVDSERRQQE